MLNAIEPETLIGPPKIRSCIIVFYYGGPSHLDMFDMKPGAPDNIRGEFKQISTSVPGTFVSELLPEHAKIMHKISVIRSMHHSNRLHDSASTESLTGRQSPQGDREEFKPIPHFILLRAALNAASPSRIRGSLRGVLVFKNVIQCHANGRLLGKPMIRFK